MERAVRTSGFGLDKGFTVCCKGPWRRGGQFSSVMGKHVVSAESSTLFYIRVPSGTLPHHDMAAIPAPRARVECMVPAAQADTARAADRRAVLPARPSQRASCTLRPTHAERISGDFAPRERRPASP